MTPIDPPADSRGDAPTDPPTGPGQPVWPAHPTPPPEPPPPVTFNAAEPSDPADPSTARRPRRFVRVAAAGVAAAVLAVSSGVAGGYLSNQFDGGGRATTRTVTSTTSVSSPGSLAAVAAKVQPSVVSINTGVAEGSGVVLTADGYVLTNNHVVATARGRNVQLTFSNGKIATATIVGTDPTNDLAVVKASGVSELTAATFGASADVQVGDTVLAIGSPLGLEGTVTAGIVSALHRDLSGGTGSRRASADQSTIADAIQTDAAINPGNSGGALVDTAGRVIGINTAIATDGQSDGNIGVGFAIPSDTAKKVADRIIASRG
jgi:putative serine protease PepD